MEHRFNRKQCHTELATFIVQRSINLHKITSSEEVMV